ncbi:MULTISPECIES: amino acid ABC transporter permease [unclassified Janthinobacterium]|uniref:amino acid ABC transporter permease n=1 Tax=unclassified Janthinobacterium TaxID=2610881 RepID=UPI00160E8F9C|nr:MULTISPECIES: amino acid ABC transporter permease [unclassified Janthinobacterium]MBB5369220.1 polar amino acid transport system permease protein [Janthinobacterium sp. K2C7]MBB5381243.1 polar amino acid transport system permease protein [Janthinobacterium sp. K2Li3]MBB5387603.1 polar amino acid transport system permease protein [Janthinobacterium sp. K2E3]
MLQFDLHLLLSGDYHDWLLSGLLLSLQLMGITLLLSLPLACGVAILRLAPSRFLNAVGAAYVESIRNVPLLAHFLFWYFGAPELLPQAWKERLYAGNIEAISAIVALTLYTAAYMAEDIRSGIRAIPAQQFEAGRALGFSFLQTMRLCILPQALRLSLPPLLSQTLNLWQNTSIATVIGVAELMYQTQRVETASFRSVEAFAFASVAYLTVSLLISGLAALLQRRAA